MPTAEEMFTAVYSQYLRPVSGFLARRVDRAEVEDLAADVFSIAWRRRETVTVGEELPWLYRIAGNVVANHRRRRATAVSLLGALRIADSAPSAEDIVVGDVSLAELWTKLRGRDREVLALAVFEDLPAPAIASALGISTNAVAIRLHRARKALTELIAATADQNKNDENRKNRHAADIPLS